jgi:hypothetical protein
MTANEQEGKRQVNTMGTKEDLNAAWELFHERIQKLKT